MYLANSQDIMRLLLDLNLHDYYPTLKLLNDEDFRKYIQVSES